MADGKVAMKVFEMELSTVVEKAWMVVEKVETMFVEMARNWVRNWEQ